MSEVMNSLLTRRSVRKYEDRPVEEEKLNEVIKAGLYAASGGGRQSSIIIAVTDREMVKKLSAMNAAVLGKEGIDPFYGAPAVLIVLAGKNAHTGVEDGSLTLGNMMLAAYDLGLGSCWIHRAKEMFEGEEGKKILKDLSVEDEYTGIGNLIIGYPAEGAVGEAAERKDGRVFWIR